MSEISWETVTSSSVEAIAHSGDTLYVRFKGGREYAYDGVDHAEFMALKESASIGREVHRLGRGGREI
jgi:hypothetical protein